MQKRKIGIIIVVIIGVILSCYVIYRQMRGYYISKNIYNNYPSTIATITNVKEPEDYMNVDREEGTTVTLRQDVELEYTIHKKTYNHTKDIVLFYEIYDTIYIEKEVIDRLKAEYSYNENDTLKIYYERDNPNNYYLDDDITKNIDVSERVENILAYIAAIWIIAVNIIFFAFVSKK